MMRFGNHQTVRRPRTSVACRVAGQRTAVATPAAGRGGVTLAEVLISVLIMSIGVVSVATLFPVAMLRSAQGNALTHATQLTRNARAMMQVLPALTHDPDGPGGITPDQFVGNSNFRKFIVDPWGFANVADERVNAKPNTPLRPYNIGGVPRFSGFSFHPVVAGHDYNKKPGSPYNVDILLRRAKQIAVLPDNWSLLVDATIISVTPSQQQDVNGNTYLTTQLTVDDAVLDDVRGLAADTLRSFVFHARRDSQGNPLKPIVEQRSTGRVWGVAMGQVEVIGRPAVAPGDRLWVHVRNENFSWLSTIRMAADGVPNGSIAVFFKRSISAEDETVYANDLQANNGRPVFMTSTALARIEVPSGVKPIVRNGGWIFDADNFQWFQITDVVTETETLIEVKLDRTPRNAGNKALLMRGIVGVFPM